MIIIIFILIALLAYFTIYAKNYVYLLEPYSNIKSLYNSQHLSRYLKNIDRNQYSNKVPSVDLNKHTARDFKSMYINSLEDVSNKYKKMLDFYINKIKIIFVKNGLNNLNKFRWKFIQSINNLEDSMPYTIDDKIVFSKKQLDKELNNFLGGNIDKRFIETLIHEQIHVIQRQNQRKFNSHYKKIYGFLLSKVPVEKIPKKIKTKYMTNPDSNFDFWIYKINDRDYYPILQKTEFGYEDIGYSVSGNEIIDLLDVKTNMGFRYDVSFYHPNEIFACVLANQIINYRLESKYSNFMRRI